MIKRKSRTVLRLGEKITVCGMAVRQMRFTPAHLKGKCIPWTKSLGPLDLGPVQVIFSWTKWGVFLGPIPVGPGIKLPVEPCFYN